MNNRNLLFALTLTCILLAFGAWTLSFFHYGAPVRQTPASQIAAPMQAGPSAEVQFNPPRPQDAPENIRDAVMLARTAMTGASLCSAWLWVCPVLD